LQRTRCRPIKSWAGLTFLRSDVGLEKHIRLLEERLLDFQVRAATQELAVLLGDDFLEFGSSGRTFDKPQILDDIERESRFEASIHDFHVRQLNCATVLATYCCVARTHETGEVRKSLRSSIWVCRQGQWQVIFHQGTLIP